MKIKAKIAGKEVVIELQSMTPLDYYDVDTEFRMGRLKFSQYAQAIIKECIASPVEARDIKFFEDSPKILDKIIYQCSKISKVGLLEKESFEIIEE